MTGIVIDRGKAEEFVPKGFELDPYFPKEGASCGVEHVRHMVKIVSPLVQSFRMVIVAQKQMVSYTALGLFSVGDRDLDHKGIGHVFYIDYFGKGKTLLAKVPSSVLSGSSSRAQGMPDALPSDILGNRILDFDDNGKRVFRLIQGPAFSEIQLYDEINRFSPRSLAALLQVVGEGMITIAGETYEVNPFVIFTANPVETEGTNPIPEALLDRIMFMLRGEDFSAGDFAKILNRTRKFHHINLQSVGSMDDVKEVREFFHETVKVSSQIEDFMGNLCKNLNNSHEDQAFQALEEEAGKRVVTSSLQGRGAIHLEGAARTLAAFRYRNFLMPGDIYKVLLPVMRHRTIIPRPVLNFFAQKWETRDSLEAKDKILGMLIDYAWNDAWRRCFSV